MGKHQEKIITSFLVFCVLLAIGYFQASQNKTAATASNTPGPEVSASSTAGHLGVRTKFANCIITAGVQDFDCTPGAVIAGVTKDQVCTPGYATSVRNVPESEKNAAYQEYGIMSHYSGEYEVDHLISLELGGSNDIANLWPEAAEPQPGFHEKDKVENYLHGQVCNGTISLQEAQLEISQHWLEVYNRIK